MKARFHYVESRQNKPKVNQKRWCSLFLLSLGKTQIYLVFHSLIRTFNPTDFRYFRSEVQKKTSFSFVLRSLIRTSDLSVEGTSARKYKRKKYFSFVFLSLIRTFAQCVLLTMVKGEAFLVNR